MQKKREETTFQKCQGQSIFGYHFSLYAEPKYVGRRWQTITRHSKIRAEPRLSLETGNKFSRITFLLFDIACKKG